jgi:predicted phosphoadenosine phosphosulfate sulfurtransferase
VIDEEHWVCLPLALRNAVSVYEPKWECWDPDREDVWIRPKPKRAIGDPAVYPWFQRGMEFEEFVPQFGEHYSQGERTACLVGIRADESLNRFRTIASTSKTTLGGRQWTSQVTEQRLQRVSDLRLVDPGHLDVPRQAP